MQRPQHQRSRRRRPAPEPAERPARARTATPRRRCRALHDSHVHVIAHQCERRDARGVHWLQNTRRRRDDDGDLRSDPRRRLHSPPLPGRAESEHDVRVVQRCAVRGCGVLVVRERTRVRAWHGGRSHWHLNATSVRPLPASLPSRGGRGSVGVVGSTHSRTRGTAGAARRTDARGAASARAGRRRRRP